MAYPDNYSMMNYQNNTPPQGYGAPVVSRAPNQYNVAGQGQGYQFSDPSYDQYVQAREETERKRAALESEYRANEARIAELKQRLATLQSDGSIDRIDRELAQNRARIGDLATSRAHQGDINTRRNTRMQWRWQAARDEAAKKADRERADANRIKTLKTEIADLDILLPGMTRAERLQAENKRKLLMDELAGLGGSYDAPTYADDESSWGKDEWDIFKIRNTDDKGRWKGPNADENRAKYENAMGGLGTSEGATAAKNSGKTTEEIRKAQEAWEREAKEADALMKKYYGKIDIDFKARWNAPVPDAEIKKLKKFYDLKDGFLVKKEKK